MEFEKIRIHLKNEELEEIHKILQYKYARDLLFKKETHYTSIESFVIGCVRYYLKQIKGIQDLSGIQDLGKPFQLQNRLEELLKQKHLNQKELSDMTGILPSNINNFVNNKHQPSLDYFFRIWIALECPPLDWLFYRIQKLE